MTIVTVQFDYPQEMHKPRYSTLLDVFRASVKKHQPDAVFYEILIPPPMSPVPDKALNFWYNTIKLRHWVRALEEINDNIIFADCDMLMLGPADSVFDQPFDVAYTKRSETRIRSDRAALVYWGQNVQRMPMNGGVMMARPTEAARDFFRQMLEVNERLYNNPEEHMKWNIKYAGMNQAAFGCLLETGLYEANVVGIPCRKWNAVDTDWHAVTAETVFVHVKSKLRRLVLMGHMPYGNFKYSMTRWYEIAEEIGVPTWKNR